MNGVEQEGHDFGKFEGTIKCDNKDGTFTFEFDRDLANANIAEMVTELTEDQRVRVSPHSPFTVPCLDGHPRPSAPMCFTDRIRQADR